MELGELGLSFDCLPELTPDSDAPLSHDFSSLLEDSLGKETLWEEQEAAPSSIVPEVLVDFGL